MQEGQGHADTHFFTPGQDPDLLSGNNWPAYLKYGVPLYQAALKGNWEAANQVLRQYPVCTTAKITKQGDTALHVAVTARHASFVQKLVQRIDPADLVLQNHVGNTALCLAAATGSVPIARLLVHSNRWLPIVRGSSNWTPLYMAALLGHKEMVRYLWPLTQDDLTDNELVELLSGTINLDLYDTALSIVMDHRNVALRILTRYEEVNEDAPYESPLHILARKSMKSSTNQQGFWRRFCNIFDGKSGLVNKENTQGVTALDLLTRLWQSMLSQSSEAKISRFLKAPPRLVFVAVEAGNVEFLSTVIHSYPDLIWKFDEKGRSIFHVAILHRQENIFQLINEVGGIKELLT